MAEIRWKQGDFIKLGRAVADFNRTIKKLENENKKLYLPEEVSYKELKDKIVTRQGFNEAIRDLKSLNKESSQQIVTIESGEEVLKWYYDKVNRNAERRQRELISQIAEFNLPENKRQKPFRTDEEKQARQELKNLKNIWKKQKLDKQGNIKDITKGERQKRLSSAYKNYDIDRQNRREKNFFQQYKKTMKRYKNMQNYEKLQEYFKNTNSREFWEKVKDDEMLRDLTYESDNTRGQDDFNRFLEHLGIEIDYNEGEPVNLQEEQFKESSDFIMMKQMEI